MNVVLAGAIVVAGIALLPVWRPLDPGLQAPAGVVGNAPPGITAALRELGRARRSALQPAAVGLVVRVRAAGPAGRHRFADRGVPASRSGTSYERVVAGVDGWQDQLDEWGVTVVVAAGDGQDAFSARLEAAGWREAYRDADGAVLVRRDRPILALVDHVVSTGHRPTFGSR